MRIARLITFNLVLWMFASTSQAQSLDEKVKHQIAGFDLPSAPVIEQLVAVAQQFHLPMGIEWVDSPKDRVAPTLHIRETTIRNLLHHILRQQPGYKFQIRDGVVHVYSPSIIDDPRNFLNIRFTEVGCRGSLSKCWYWVGVKIIQARHPTWNLGGGYGGASQYRDFDLLPITFSGKDMMLRQVLSKMAALEGNALWVTRLRRTQMMKNEPYYAQIPDIKTGDVSSNFAWRFIALDADYMGERRDITTP